MKIVLCSAHINEIKKVIRYYRPVLLEILKKKYSLSRYSDDKNDIYFLVTGMGRKNTDRSLSYFQNKYKLDRTCQWILTGFCGSLIKSDEIGRIIIPDIIRNAVNRITINESPKIEKRKKEGLFCVDRIFGLKDKIQLKGQYADVSAVDMESMAYCENMKKNKFREFFVYKSVSDDLEFVFPDFQLLKGSFLHHLKMCLLYILKDFKQIIFLIRLVRNINIASQSIFNFFIKYYEKHRDK